MSILTRALLSKAGGGLLTGRTACIRNFTYLNTRVAPVLSSAPSNQKPLQVLPLRNSSHGNHVPLWTAEKALSAALLPLIPAAFMFPSPIMDYILAFSLAIHSHWGIEAIVVDYVRPSIFGPVIPKLAVGLVYVLSALTFGGLCYFTYSDVGLTRAVKLLWRAE